MSGVDEGAGTKRSLTTEIKLSFGESIKEVQGMAKELSTLSSAMGGMDGGINITKLKKEIDNLGQLLAGGRGTFTSDGWTQFKQKLNAEVSRGLGLANFQFAQEQITQQTYFIKLDKESTGKLRRLLKIAATKAMRNIDFEPGALNSEALKVTVSGRNLALLQTALNNALSNNLAEKLDFSELKAEGAKQKVKFKITAAAMGKMVEAVQEEFFKIMAGSNIIQIEDLHTVEPIKIDAKGLEKALVKVQGALKHVEDEFAKDLLALESMSAVNTRLNGFKSGIQESLKQVNEVAGILDAIKFSNGDNKSKTELQKAVLSLHDTVSIKVKNLLKDVVGAIQFPTGISVTQTEQFAKFNSKISDTIHSHISKEIDGVVEMLRTSLNHTQTKGAEGRAAWEKGMKEVTSHIDQSTNKAMKQVAAHTDFHIDTEGVARTINQFTEFVTDKITNTINHSLHNMSGNIGSVSPELKVDLVNNLINPVKVVLENMFVSIKGSMDTFALLTAANVNAEATKASATAIDVAHIKDAVNGYFKRYTTALAESVKSLDPASTFGKYNVQTELVKAASGVSTFMSRYSSHLVTEMKRINKEMTLDNTFSVPTRSLPTEVKRMLSDRAGVRTISEYQKQNPVQEGEKAFASLTSLQMESMMKLFHERLMKDVTAYSKLYREGLNEVKTTELHKENLVHFLTSQLERTLRAIATKIKKELTQQFDLMIEEIKNINATPVSLGYNARAQTVTRGQARRGSSTGAPQTISGGVPEQYRGGGNTEAYPLVPFQRDYATQAESSKQHTLLDTMATSMRYMTAGALIGLPTMLVHEGLAAFKEFDYNMARAQQNFLVKDPTMNDVSASRLAAMNQQGLISNADYNNPTTYNKLLNKDASDMRGLATGGATRSLQDMAFAYGVSTPDISKAFYTASRRLGDPTQSLALTKEIAKVKGVDGSVDVEHIATGFESIASQWGIAGEKFTKVADMLIKAAHTTQADMTDLLETQGRSGAIFRNALPLKDSKGNPDVDAQLAASIALSAIYVQSTARSGAVGGTFFKSILETQLDPARNQQLRNLNKLPAFKDVNFTPITNNADGTQTQATAIDTLGGLVDASKKVTTGDMQKILKIVVPMQQAGGQTAISQFMQDLTRSADQIRTVMTHANAMGANVDGTKLTKDSSTADVLKEYISKIQSANEHDSALIMAGMMDTWKFKEQQVKTMFESATQGVFSGLKGEFANTATYLNDFLKIVRNNAGGIASLIGVISNVGLALGVRYLAGKTLSAVDNDRKSQLAKRVDLLRGGLNEEGRSIDLRRQLKDKELEELNKQRQPVQGRIGRLTKIQSLTDLKLGKQNTILADVQGERQGVATQLGKLNANANADPADVARLRGELQALDDKALKQQAKVDFYADRAGKIKGLVGSNKNEDARLANQLKGHMPEMVAIAASAQSLNSRMRMTDVAAKDHGIDESKLKNSMQQVSGGFSQGAVEAKAFDKALVQLSRDAGIDVDVFKKLDVAMRKLEADFKSGTIKSKEYRQGVQTLQRQFATASANLTGGGTGGAGGNQSASQLLMMIAAGSQFANPETFTRNSRPIMQRFQDAISATKAGGLRSGLRGLAFNGALVRDASGNVSRNSDGKVQFEGDIAAAFNSGKTAEEIRTARALEGEAGLGRFARLGQFAKSSALTAGVMMGASAIGTRAMRTTATAGEIQEMNANNALALERQQGGYKNGSLGTKIFSLIGGIFGTLSDQIAGGGATKLREQVDRKGKTQQEIEAEITTVGIEARMKQQEEIFKANKNQTYLLDDKGQIKNTRYERVITLDDAQQMLTPINNELQSRQVIGTDGINGANGIMGSGQYDVMKTKMLIGGFREDSKEIRQLTDEFLTGQVTLLQTASDQIKTQLDAVVLAGQGDTPAGLALKAELAAKQSGIAQTKLQQRANKLSTIDNILQPLNRDMKGTKDEFAIKMSDATLGGATDDSQLMKNINAEMYKTLNSQISAQLPKLQAELGQYSPKDEAYKNLWLQIKDLQVEQKDNLVKIRQALTTSLSTFNLPQGISAMTYYESVTAKGTHKNMSVVSGDTIVNLTVKGDVNGDETVQKIADAVSGAVKPYNDVSRQLADNVKRKS